MAEELGDLWVFGYGSLMWRPGFPFVERHMAHLRGYHRSLCVFSHFHRGTPERPGLVLGLDRGGSCRGAAFLVRPGRRAQTVAYLRAREQVTSVYVERYVPVMLDDGRLVTALVFVVDRQHVQYAGRLSGRELVDHVRWGIGVSGANPEYVRNTHVHLVEVGVRDPILEQLVQALERSEAEVA